MAGEYLPPVVARITGDVDGLVAAVARAKAALASLKNESGQVKVGFDVSAASMAKATLAAGALDQAVTRNVNTGRRWTGWLAAAHTVLTVFGANIVADTIGIVAFGIGATTAISPVIGAINNLGQTYGYLSPVQQAATDRLTAFINQFRNANQTGIFSVFNGLMDMVGNHVGKTGGIMDQATHAFENFVAMLRQSFASGPWQQLFSKSTGIIQQDMTTLFRFINALINVIPALVHDFNGWGLATLNAASYILHLIAVLGNADPALARFAFGAFAIYRILRMIGAFDSQSGLRTFAAGAVAAVRSGGILANTLQSIKTYGIGTTAFLLTGLTPAMFAVAGGAAAVAAAMIYVAVADSKYQDSTQQLIQTLAQQDHATGSNLAGYEKLSGQLSAYNKQLNGSVNAYSLTAGAAAVYRQKISDVSSAQSQANQTISTLKGNLGYLEQTYHLTQQQAYQLAKATGTNLTQAFNKGGGAAQATRLKIAAYEQTVKAAQNPSTTLAYDLGLASNKALQLDDRVAALTNAFNALLTPFANVIQDTVTWKDGNNQLEAAVDKAKGKVNDLGSSTQRLAAQGLANAINNTVKLSQDTLQQTGSMQKAIGPVQAEINILKALGSRSAIVAQAIANLQAYINSLHSKTVTIQTNMVTAYSSTYSHIGAQGGHAAGTSNAPPGWSWVGERGPELMYMRGGEKIASNAQSVAMAGGGGGVVERQPIIIMLDGHPIYQVTKDIVAYKNQQNGVRTPKGSVQGRFGTRT